MRVCIVFILSVLYLYSSGQGRRPGKPRQNKVDSTMFEVSMHADTDSAAIVIQSPKVISPNAITDVVHYSAHDSVINDIQNRFTYLYGDASVTYEDMELRADYIEIDFKNNQLYACGVADSLGRIHGAPVFLQGDAHYNAREIMYNFTTHKGKITDVITTQDDGYIHGEQVKKMGDNVAYIKRGKYTTCELGDPHYEIAFSKAKVIQHDKILIGPAHLRFSGIPTMPNISPDW